MDETALPEMIREHLQPGRSRIPTTKQNCYRLVTSIERDCIAMQVGRRTHQTKAITYEMVAVAYRSLLEEGQFTLSVFRDGFNAQYDAAPCRYSMTGGVLVFLGLAILSHSQIGASYIPAPDSAGTRRLSLSRESVTSRS